MGWCRICSLTLLFLLLTSHSVHAYERDVHYDLTKYLARWAGFSETEAEQIGAADQELDAKAEFNPMPNPNFCPKLQKLAVAAPTPAIIEAACKEDPEFQRMLTAQRAYHFADGKRLQELKDSAFRGKNLKTLGHYLHVPQDTFAHSLMDYKDLPPMDRLVASLGFMPDEKIIGHFLYGHSVDKTYERPDLAEQMARYVYAELTRFTGSTNRWNEVEAAVVRFANAKDLDKKLRYLSASSPPSHTIALPQPPGLPTTPQEPMHEGRTFVEWQADLRDSSSKIREKAAQALRHFGEKAVPILAQTLKDTDANVRWAAAHALGEIGPAAKDAVPALIQALEDIDGMVRSRVKSTLRQIDPSVLEDRERAERAAAKERARQQKESAQPQAQALSGSGATAIRALLEALGDKDAEVRRKAAEALLKMDPPSRDQVPALIDILKSSNIAVARKAAAVVLGELATEAGEAVPALRQASTDSDGGVRGAAAAALRRIKFPNAPPGPCQDRSGRIRDSIGDDITNTSAGRRMSTMHIRPCLEEGDEEKKAAADRVNAAFVRAHKVNQSVNCTTLSRNPFTYEGKVVLVHLTFEQMAGRDKVILGEENSFGGFGGCGIVVSGVPHGIFSTDRVRVVLAGKVLGDTEAQFGQYWSMKFPHLEFSGVHICKEKDCVDFFGPESMR